MKTAWFGIALIGALSSAGCQNTDEEQPLQEAKAAYIRAATDPLVADRAPLELMMAKRALDEAEHDLRWRSAGAAPAYEAILLSRHAELMGHRRARAEIRLAADYWGDY